MKNTSNDFPVLAVIGPSGTGKSTAIRLLAEDPRVEVVPTWTTRPSRPDEKLFSIEHRFVSARAIHQAQKNGQLLEVIQMFNLPYWYGLPAIQQPTDNRLPVIILRASIVKIFARHFPNFKIYQIVDSQPNIHKRLQSRQLNGEALGTRLDEYRHEISLGQKIADRTFINDSTPLVLSKRILEAIQEDFDI